MIIAIIGSRTVYDYEALKSLLAGEQVTEVVSGGAAGVDALAERWAREHGKPLTVIRPDYTRYGRRAPMVRNAEIVKQADKVVALWDGESKGTAATIRMARKAGKPITVHTWRADPGGQMLTL
jgi:hypothetical protein